MANNNTPILDAISVLHSWAEDYTNHLDGRLSEEDDGERHTVKEAKEEFDRQIETMIESLQTLRVEMKNSAFKNFINKHL